MKIFLSAAVLAALCVATPAAAQIYGAVGYTNYDLKDRTNVGAVSGKVGWNATDMLGVEADFAVGVGDNSYNPTAAAVTLELDHDYAVYGVARYPVTPELEVFGRLGYGHIKVQSSTGNTGGYGFSTDSLNYGVGAQYFMGQNGIRGEVTRYEYMHADKSSATALSVSYVRKF